MKRATIKRKLISVIMGTSLTVLALTCAVFIGYEYVTFRKALVRGLTLRAEMFAGNSSAALAFYNQADAAAVLSVLSKDPHIVAACLYDNQGRLFAQYPSSTPSETFPPTPGRPGHRFDRGHFILFHPVLEENRFLGTFYLKSDLSAMRERFQLYSLIVLIVVAGSIVVAFGLANRFQKGILEPILTLAKTARSVSECKDYSLRARKLSEDEMGLLTDSFNEMLGQIQQRDASLRRNEGEIRKLNADLERRVQQRTGALEDANRELESFSYSVSHDLRAPLRHIDGFLGLLKKRCAAVLDEKGHHYLNNICGSAKQMGKLIDDLLAFSRMGRSELRASSVELTGLVQASVNDLALETEGRDITWEIGPLPQVAGDPGLLRQVWANLLSNAVKYTRGREKPKIEIGVLPNGNGEHIFFVRDNGAGFDMEYADKLFGVFQRLHRADEFEGTGIGLANVRRIVSRHGGRTWAEGKVGAGAIFYFSLPK